MEREPVESKALASIGHDPETEVLEVEFHNGRVYQYRGVPAELHAWLMRSRDKGGLFNRLVDGKFEFERVDLIRAEGMSLEEALRASLRPSPGEDD